MSRSLPRGSAARESGQGGLVIRRGEIWWAELTDQQGPEPGYRRPVVIVQSDAFNRSRIGTITVVAITSNLSLAQAPGNVRLSCKDSRLPREAVVNVAQILTLDRRLLAECVGLLPGREVEKIDAGLRLVYTL